MGEPLKVAIRGIASDTKAIVIMGPPRENAPYFMTFRAING
jgi:hypothetical protein